LSRPTNYKITTVSKKWIIAGELDKFLLRKEIADFCDQYPVYRLKEYVPGSVSVARGKSMIAIIDMELFESASLNLFNTNSGSLTINKQRFNP